VSQSRLSPGRAYPADVDVTLQPTPRGWPRFGWIREYSELLLTLLRRELRVKYKGSSLGILWSYLYPLAMVGVYTLVFSVLWHAVNGIPHYPLFVLVGIAVWTFFQAALQLASASIVANGHLIRNVRFPREVIPAAVVLSQAVASVVMFAVLIPVSLVIVPDSVRTAALTVPIFGAFLLLTLGLGWLVATATVFFRDVEHLLAVLFLPWFFLTPVLYSLDTLPRAANHPWLIHLLRYGNPVTPYIEAFRGALVQGQVAGPSLLIYVFVAGPVAALLGLWCIQRYEDRFAIEI
jgi:ABC-type polysaccharide/polyol phosphate export permease